MRKLNVIVLTILTLTFGSLMAGELTKNDLHVLGKDDFSSKNSFQTNNITVPELGYEYEYSIKENITFSLESGVGINLRNDDSENDNTSEVWINAAAKLEYELLPNITFENTLPIGFASTKSTEKNANAQKVTNVTYESELSYSNNEEDLEGFSPWNSYEQGFSIGAILMGDIYQRIENNVIDDKDYSIGTEISYAYFNKEKAFMVKPSVSISKHLNNDVSEVVEFSVSNTVYKDINKKFTSGVEFSLNGSKENTDSGTINSIDFIGSIIYYPTEKNRGFA